MEEASYDCCTDDEEHRLVDLLTRYQDVFSTHDRDVGKNTLVEQHIPLVEGARPIRQPPHWLDPAKETEVDKPANGAWSSPVVMVNPTNKLTSSGRCEHVI